LFAGCCRAVGAKANVVQCVGLVRLVAPLLILPKRWLVCSFVRPLFFSTVVRLGLLITFCVLPQLAISEHFTVNLHKSLIGALSFNFARHRQLRQHAVTGWH